MLKELKTQLVLLSADYIKMSFSAFYLFLASLKEIPAIHFQKFHRGLSENFKIISIAVNFPLVIYRKWCTCCSYTTVQAAYRGLMVQHMGHYFAGPSWCICCINHDMKTGIKMKVRKLMIEWTIIKTLTLDFKLKQFNLIVSQTSC